MNGIPTGEVVSHVAVAVAVLALAWVVHQACERRVAGRHVRRLTIDLPPDHHRDTRGAELLERVGPDELVIDLTQGLARRTRRRRR
jgi:hypothetical protein